MNNAAEKVLSILRKHEDYVSEEEISQALGITRKKVGEHVRRLRELGYELSSAPGKGYMLKAAPNVPSDLEVKPFLKTISVGRRYKYFKTIDSTNTYLASLYPSQAVHGMVVAADRQTAGRGRMQRSWHSPAGENLYFSILLRPEIVPTKVPQLALVTVAALLKVLISRFPDLSPKVKWPNDILVQGRKLAGILCEMRSEMGAGCSVIIGIGINVNSRHAKYPAELRDSVISLLDATGKIANRQKLVVHILAQLETCYEIWLKEGLQPFIDFLEDNSALKNQEITVVIGDREITGTVRGLSGNGALKLETPDGILQISSGEVHLKKVKVVNGRG